MSKRGTFDPNPEDVISMKPIHEGDREYGYKIFELYAKSLNPDLSYLFRQGLSGIILGEPDPKSDPIIRTILQSGDFCRPEDQGELRKGSIVMSPGQYITCNRHSGGYRNLRWFRDVRLQGDFAALLQDDYPDEDTGTIAVAVAGALAMNGYLPSNKKGNIAFKEMKLAAMSEDETHDKPWIAAEVDMYIHQSLISPMPLPHDNKTGYVPLEVLERILEEEDK